MIAKNKYGLYSVPEEAKDRPCAKKILQGKVYEPKTIKFIRKHGKGKVVVHAGAFFGDFLPAIDKTCSHVYAFEPNPLYYKHAKETVQINKLKNTWLLDYALSDSNKTVKLNIDENGFTTLSKEGNRDKVYARTLDSLIPIRVSLIHLDVEYHEYEVLLGAEDILKTCKPILILETAKEDPRIWELLKSLGYKANIFRLHNNTVFTWRGR